MGEESYQIAGGLSGVGCCTDIPEKRSRLTLHTAVAGRVRFQQVITLSTALAKGKSPPLPPLRRWSTPPTLDPVRRLLVAQHPTHHVATDARAAQFQWGDSAFPGKLLDGRNDLISFRATRRPGLAHALGKLPAGRLQNKFWRLWLGLQPSEHGSFHGAFLASEIPFLS